MSDFTYGASNRAYFTVGHHGHCQRVHFLPEGFNTHCFCKISQVNRGAEQRFPATTPVASPPHTHLVTSSSCDLPGFIQRQIRTPTPLVEEVLVFAF